MVNASGGEFRSECRVYVAGRAGGRPPEGGTPSKFPREPSRCRRHPLGIPRPRGGGGAAEDRLKAELRANARASRADVGATRWESRVHAALRAIADARRWDTVRQP